MLTVLAYAALVVLGLLLLGFAGWVLHSVIAVILAAINAVLAKGKDTSLGLLFLAVLMFMSSLSTTMLTSWCVYFLLRYLGYVA